MLKKHRTMVVTPTPMNPHVLREQSNSTFIIIVDCVVSMYSMCYKQRYYRYTVVLF
jgi:hypothetical protein